MKKINSFILFGAAVFAFAACSNETQIENSPKPQEPVYETLSVKIGNEATTRVTLAGTADSKSVFETGDQIAVWTDVNAFQVCAVDGSGNITVDVTRPRSNYAVYYTGATAPTFVSSTLKITLPDTYDYDDVAGDKNPVPMVAVNEAGAAGDMTFYAVCGLARITVTGIPATADKLEVTFDKDVTGEFTVADLATTPFAPYISATAATSKNKVYITLTPGTNYTGAVINIPVPVGTVYASVWANKGASTITGVGGVIPSWDAARAHGKKAICKFDASINSMILAPGNLYTDGSGNLTMADNYYENIYAFSGNNGDYANDAGYSKFNRTHFNFNETYLLMKTGALSDNNDAYTNADTYDLTKNIGGVIWRVPTQADWCTITTGEAPGVARPGATLNATITSTSTSSSTSGWKFIKVLVTDMDANTGTTKSDGTAQDAANSPKTTCQAGLLLFPDNVEITGTFGTLGTPNKKDAANNSTTITKTNLDALIAVGCAFLPAVGRFATSFGKVGENGGYWSCTQVDGANGYYLNFGAGNVNTASNDKSTVFRSVRLVRDLQ